MADGAYTQEYRALKRLVPELRIAVQRNIVTLSGILLSKALISSEVDSLLRDELSRSKESRAAELVSIILDKVKINRENFTIFIDILKACGDHYSDLVKLIESEMNKTDNQTTCGHPARPDDGRLADPAQSSGTQSPGTQSPGIQSSGTQSPGIQSPGTQSHHAHEVASQCFICTNKLGCPEPLEKISFPYLDPSNVVQLDDREKRDLEFRLKRETKHMILSFQGLVFQLYKTIDMGKKVSINELKFLLKGIKALPNRSEKSLFEEYSDKLSAASSILCIFEVITQFCSFIDYSIVEYLINHLGSDSDKERMKNYQTEFNEYAKRRIIECPVSIKPADNSRWSITYIKMDSKLENLTIKQFLEFRFKVGKILNMDVAAIHFCCAHSGCIQFTCQIPLFVTKAVFPISSDQAMSLKQLGVIWFSCAGYEYSAQEMTLQLSSCAKDKDTVKDQLESALITSMETEPPTKRIKLGEEPERESAVSVPWTPIADPFPQSSAALQCLQSAVQDTTPGLRANVQGPYQGVGSSFSPSAYSSTPRPHHHPLMQRFTIPGEGTSGSNMPQRTISIHNISMPLQPVFTSPPAWTVGRAKQQSSQYDDQSFILHGLGEGTSDGNTSQTTVSVQNLSMPLQPVVFTSPQLGGAEKQSDRETATPANMLQASIFQGCNAPAPVRSEAFNVTMTCHSHMQDTTEYQTIKKCAPELKIATQHTLTKLSGHLLSRGLITVDQYGELMNIMHSESDRAAKLISLILNKVELAPKYYSVFINVLEEDKLNNEVVLELLERTYSSLTSGASTRSIVQTIRPSAMSILNKHLMDCRYVNLKDTSDESLYLPKEKFITLAVIEKDTYVNRGNADDFTRQTLHDDLDDILKRKKPIEMEAVLEPPEGQENVRCVFVEGAPGVGKSTFVFELYKRQKEIKSMAKYTLVLLLQLRDKEVQVIQNVGDIFKLCHDDPNFQQSVSEEVTACCGKNVLFILDGFDELPAKFRNDSESFLVKLIRGRHLPACTVLVTSRPSASASLLNSVKEYKHIEVIGFTQEQIKLYAQSMLTKQPDVLNDFLRYVSVNPAVRSMMYVPLNSAIVLKIYLNNRSKNKQIPCTLTELYTELCLMLLKKYDYHNEKNLQSSNEHRILSFENLPQTLKEKFTLLSKKAFEGILNQETVFEQLPVGCDELGFTNVSTRLYLQKKSYSFLHLTLQEFLAAYYFSQLSPNEQKLKFICNSIVQIENEPVRKSDLDVMWTFVAGLTGFKHVGWKLVNQAMARSWDNNNTMYISRYLYEIQDEEVVKATYDELFPAQTPKAMTRTLLDCYFMGFCIAVSGRSWDFSNGGFFISGDEAVEMLGHGLKSVSAICGSISSLNLSGSKCTRKAISQLNDHDFIPIDVLKKLTHLYLGFNQLDKNAFDELSSLIPYIVYLEHLSLNNNPGGDGAVVKLCQKLQLIHLRSLKISGITLDLSDIQALSQLLKSTDCLEDLDIGDFYMCDECISLMVEVIFSSLSLKQVTFDSIEWTTDNVDKFALLENNKSITVIYFVFHEDFDDDLDDYFDCIEPSNSLNSVIPAVAKALHKNDTLLHLGLPPCTDTLPFFEIQHESIVALAQMLKVNETLTHLDVSTRVSVTDIQILTSALQENCTLDLLHLQSERITISLSDEY